MRHLRVAIVGSGPAGVYCAAALTERDDVTVDIIDRLPTPFGLVRYGVAPDHEKMKSVANTLRKVFLHEQVRFLGNVEFGRDISLAELHNHYDAVIMAQGAAIDRRLGVAGEDLPGSFSATEFVSWYSGHPDAVLEAFTLQAETVVVIGVGNVAVDVARVMSKTAAELRSTDVPDHVLEVLSSSQVRDVFVVGRRGPVQAKFTTKELRELGELDNVDVIVDPDELEVDAASELTLETNAVARRNLEILREWSQRTPEGRPRRLHLKFLLRPTSITGDEAVSGMTFARTRLDGNQNSIDTGVELHFPAQMVLRSVGYRGIAAPDLPFDEDRGVIPNDAGRVRGADGFVPGEYVAGWIKRGPTGIIGTNKTDANETVRSLFEDAADLPVATVRDSTQLLELLGRRGVQVVEWDGWEAIEALEIAAGQARGAKQVKVAGRERLLAAARAQPTISS
jgi:ferredoxin/flavodoxin---NADP+ reductase